MSGPVPGRSGTASSGPVRAFVDRTIGLLGAGYLLVAGMTIYDITARYLFARPTIWALELSVLVCAVLYLVSCIAATLQDAHIRIDLMERQVRRVVPDAALSAIELACALIFLGAIAYGGYVQARNAVLAGERSGTMLDSYAPTILKVGIPVVAITIACALIARFLRRPRPRG